MRKAFLIGSAIAALALSACSSGTASITPTDQIPAATGSSVPTDHQLTPSPSDTGATVPPALTDTGSLPTGQY